MIFVRDDIPTKEIKINFLPSDRVSVYRNEYKENKMADCWLLSSTFTE